MDEAEVVLRVAAVRTIVLEVVLAGVLDALLTRLRVHADEVLRLMDVAGLRVAARDLEVLHLARVGGPARLGDDESLRAAVLRRGFPQFGEAVPAEHLALGTRLVVAVGVEGDDVVPFRDAQFQHLLQQRPDILGRDRDVCVRTARMASSALRVSSTNFATHVSFVLPYCCRNQKFCGSFQISHVRTLSP